MSIIKRLIIIIGSLFILTGCTDTKIVVPIHEYAELPIEGLVTENLGEEIDNEKNSPENPNQNVYVYSETGVVEAFITGFCWNESIEEDCNLSENPKEETQSELALTLNKGEEINISILLKSEEFSDSIRPHQVEVIQFGVGDDEGKLINSETVIREVTFSAPDEKGAHYYLIHVLWDADKTKRAYYAFRTVVR